MTYYSIDISIVIEITCSNVHPNENPINQNQNEDAKDILEKILLILIFFDKSNSGVVDSNIKR